MLPVTIKAASGVLFDGAYEPFTSRIWFIEIAVSAGGRCGPRVA
jgi:hypothetical protein